MLKNIVVTLFILSTVYQAWAVIAHNDTTIFNDVKQLQASRTAYLNLIGEYHVNTNP